MKYYKIETKEIINTVNEIPVEMLEKKGLLPYKKVIIQVYDDEVKPEDCNEIIDGVYVETIYQVIHRKTLDEVKKDKINELYSTYEQISNEGFVCSNGIKLDCREKDKINWLVCQLSGGTTPIIDFFDVTHTNLESNEVIQMLSELTNYYMKNLYDRNKLRNMVNDATTIEEVESIFWRKSIMDEDGLKIIDWEYNEVL